MDKYNELFNAVCDEFAKLVVEGDSDFFGFQMYRSGVPSKGIHFPAAILKRGEFGVSDYFVGGGTTDFIEITIELGFLPKDTAVSDETILYENEALTTKFGASMRKFVGTLREGTALDTVCNMDSIKFTSEPKYLENGDVIVFGLSTTITINFEGE